MQVIKTYPEAQPPAAIPLFSLHSDSVRQVPFRLLEPDSALKIEK